MMKLLKIFALSIITATFMVSTSLAQDVNSQMVKLLPEVHKAVDADAERVIEIYRDIHENAELGLMEVRTAGIVAKELRALGFDVKTEIV